MAKKALKKYLHILKYAFPYLGKQETLYIKRLRSSLNEYILEFPDSTYDDLVLEFGTPENLVINYYYELNDSLLLHRLYFRKKFFLFCITVFILFTIFIGYKSINMYNEYNKTINNNISYDTEQITYQ